ncbi:MAG: chemotaxis protein chel [Rhodospirillaceae bacterium]|nr:chemotaxis protein chel [Rhodospirillaceae bacterium]|tara:strand:+ start:673 stop:1011 length:339 start_codon:yes stop_codon:yes gene_type:complete
MDSLSSSITASSLATLGGGDSFRKLPGKGLKQGQSSAEIKKVARQFEGMFLSQMFGHMFKGIKTDGLMGGGNGEEIFRGLLLQEYGSSVAKAGGIGLAKSIERQLLTLQETK